MLRLLHTADAHLGARHGDLGEAASALRERQHAAFRAAVELAVAERVDAVLIAGDLFDANTASRRTVERAVAGLTRLAAARIRVVIIPGDHDAYTRSSVYRAYDLASLVGDGMLTVLTPEAPWVHLETLDAVVVGAADTSRTRTGTGGGAAEFADLSEARVPATTWRIGLLHAALGDAASDGARGDAAGAGPRGDAASDGPRSDALGDGARGDAAGDGPRGDAAGDGARGEAKASAASAAAEDASTELGELGAAAIAASGLDFVALGHGHTAATGKAGAVTWAVAGSPEQVTADRHEPGTVNLVTLDERGGSKTIRVETRVVGSSWHRELEVDATQLVSQAALVERLRAAADPELVFDVRIVGERPDELVLDPAAIEEALRGAYLYVRVADCSRPPLTTGALPPPETISGAFIRNVEARIAELEAADGDGADDEATELREVLRLGRRLLAGAEVTR
jgi:DNA repair exonuclease SbcCD nuclease subunit